MSPVRSLTEAIDNLYTTTWQNMKGEVADQIFDATPFWFWLREHKAFDRVEGGRYLSEPLRYAKSDNVAWIKKGSTVVLDDKEFLTTAQFEWSYLSDSIVRFGVDDQQNRGKNQIINLMKAKLANSKDTLVSTLEGALCGTKSGDSMHGIRDLILDDPTTNNSYGGIPNDTYTWWRNQTKNMTGLSYATYGVYWLRNMINNCMNNLAMDRPDLIVSGQTPYEMYEDAVVEQKRIVNKTLGDAGFENIEYKGIPMIWTPSIANTRQYVVNTKFLRVKYDPSMYFDMTEWKAIPDQVNDRAAQIVSALQLCTSRRRVHGVLHTIDTP